MRAVRIHSYGAPFELVHVPVPRPGFGEVLVQVHASGLCSTDLHIRNGVQDLGFLPRIPGHEFAGEIAEVGTGVTGWTAGDRVMAAIDVVCGSCEYCLSGRTQLCSSLIRLGFEIDGGHADFVIVPSRNLVALPDSLEYSDAAIIPDAIACMYHCLVGKGNLRSGHKVAILGAGGLGLHGVQICRLAGAEVFATSRRSKRLEMVSDFGGIPINTGEVDLEKTVLELTGGEGVDIVADCIGTRESAEAGFSILKPGGNLLIIAYLDESFEFPSKKLFSLEKEIIGCRGTSMLELQEVARLVAAGDIKPIIGKFFPLEDIEKAAGVLESGNVTGRIVLTR